MPMLVRYIRYTWRRFNSGHFSVSDNSSTLTLICRDQLTLYRKCFKPVDDPDLESAVGGCLEVV